MSIVHSSSLLLFACHLFPLHSVLFFFHDRYFRGMTIFLLPQPAKDPCIHLIQMQMTKF